MKLSFYLKIFLLFILVCTPLISFGEDTIPDKYKIVNPLGNKNSDLFVFVATIISAALKIGALAGVIAVIFAGFMFVTAQGDDKKIELAKKTLLYTIIGIVILLGAEVISKVIQNTVKSVQNSTL